MRQHSLLKLLSSGPQKPWAQQGQDGGSRSGSSLHPQEEEGKQQYFPMRLSPTGARSLLFANFWVSLLDAPLRWVRCLCPIWHSWRHCWAPLPSLACVCT